LAAAADTVRSFLIISPHLPSLHRRGYAAHFARHAARPNSQLGREDGRRVDGRFAALQRLTAGQLAAHRVLRRGIQLRVLLDRQPTRAQLVEEAAVRGAHDMSRCLGDGCTRSGGWRSRPDSGAASSSGLRWDDVDERAVHVRRQVLVRPRAVQGQRRVYVRQTLKNRRARRVRLDEQTASVLRR
jgi:hypothetical protein